MKIERLGHLKTDLGECPVWHAQQLWLLDCRRGVLYALDPDSGDITARHEVPAPLGSFAFNHDGQVVLALKDAVVALDLGTGHCRPLASLDTTHPHLRLNDGTAMPDGSFVVGTMHVYRADDEPPLGGLYHLGTDLSFTRVDTGFGITNGPAVSPLNGRLHVADSAVRTIYSYALAPDGTLSDKQVFVQTDLQGSAPDGCCFDHEGGLWTALVRAGALARYDAGGQLTHRIELPLVHPAALCFGGPDMGDLFVTSISDSGRLSASGPMDGAVLKVTGLGFQGMARPLCRLPL